MRGARRPGLLPALDSAGPLPGALGALGVLLLLCLAVTLALGTSLHGRLWAQGQHGTAEQWAYHVWLESRGYTEHHRPAALSPERVEIDPVTSTLTGASPPVEMRLVAHAAPSGASPESTALAVLDPAPPQAPAVVAWRRGPAQRETFTSLLLSPPELPPRAGQ
jgi:hypothetical protein